MIFFEEVTKIHNRVVSLENLNIEINSEKITVVLGKGKSGKTTMLNMINGLDKPDIGEVYINNINIKEFDSKILKSNCGYMTTGGNLFSNMSVKKNIYLLPKKLKWDKENYESRVQEYFEIVELNYYEYINKKVYELNEVEYYKIALIRAFLNNSSIVILDEPFKEVTVNTRMELQEDLIKFQKALKRTIVFATDNIEEAVKIGNYIIILNEGKLEVYDKAESIMSNPKSSIFTESLSNDLYLNMLESMKIEDYMIPKYGKEFSEKISENKTLKDALSYMFQKTVYDLDIIGENGKIVGALNVKDIIKALTYLKGDQNE
ncbi:ATP-binding cassette domain-containing protein [Clostridium ihumii]|uniref:ATP-binding cassette domain-containing protein n=1 Tax=Clostridium ihumii TaxID=1470356 RepID=UPI00058B00AA|nr:ATP-binding cassette domain-containing protein [Clostridium ihumii]